MTKPLEAPWVGRLRQAWAAQQAGRWEEARRGYEAVLREQPGEVNALTLLGAVWLAEGQPSRARQQWQQCLRRHPNHPPALVGLAQVALAERQPALAKEPLHTLLESQPQHVEAWCLWGQAAQELGDWAEACRGFQQAVELKPDLAQAWYSLGAAHYCAGADEPAQTALERAVSLREGYAAAWSLLGAVRLRRDDEPGALQAAEKAVAVDPAHAEGWNNLANVLLDLGRAGEAEAALRRALSLKNGYVEAWTNLGNALVAQERRAEAITTYEEALRLAPGAAAARYNLGMAQLARGDFVHGWTNYEARWDSVLRGTKRGGGVPEWTGVEPVAGAVIRVYTEQGLGDSLQFGRYLAALQARGARVVAEMPRPLHRLMAASFPGVDIVARGEGPRGDWQVALMSLPRCLGVGVAQPIETAGAYLRVPEECRQGWPKPTGEAAVRVGLVWSGNLRHRRGLARTIGAAALAEALEGWDCAPVGLVKEVRPVDAPVAARWPSWAERLSDFAETSAALETLDLVITVDTAVAHLSGGLGCPTWVVLPFGADWRWFEGRDDSPWYPTVKLFRQTQPGDWSGVVAALRAEGEKIRARR